MNAFSAVSAGSFAELSTFMKEQMLLLERTEQTRHETEAKIEAKMETRMEEQRQQMQEQRQQMQEQMKEQRQQIEELKRPHEAISAQQMKTLTARLEAMHAAKMLSDDELFAVEDLRRRLRRGQSRVRGRDDGDGEHG